MGKSIKKFEFLGEKLLEFRKEKGLSQEELANKINVSRQSIHLWESGKMTPDIENIISLCDVLEIKTSQLTNGLELIENSKKFNKTFNKRKITSFVLKLLLILLIIYLIISLRKSIILMRLSNNGNKYFGLDNYSYTEKNYYMENVTTSKGMYTLEVYYKDKVCKKIYKDSIGSNIISYEDYQNNIRYNFDLINNTFEENLSYNIELPDNISIQVGLPTLPTYGKEYQIINFIYGFNPFFTIESNKSEYIFKWSNKYDNYTEKTTEKVDKNSGLVSERYVFKDDGTYILTNYEININATTNEQIKLLDKSNYQKKN